MSLTRHDYVCPDCGFQSNGWPDEESAAARGEQHQTEHETGKPMPALIPDSTEVPEPDDEEL